MVTSSPGLTQIREAIIASGSAFLRNSVWQPGRTCSVCAGVTKDGWSTCWQCHDRASNPAVADRVGSMVYAWRGHQSGRMMHAYKSPVGAPASADLVQSLLVYGVAAHWPCVSAPFGRPDGWAVVPSLAGRAGQHPLMRMAEQLMVHYPRVDLQAAPVVQAPRAFAPQNFVAEQTRSRHVLLLDDTWTSGNHAQSASAALKVAGAQRVTILTVARWLDLHFADTSSFLSTLTADLDPDRCPFTGLPC